MMVEKSDTFPVYLILVQDFPAKSVLYYVSYKTQETENWIEIKGWDLTSDQVKEYIKNKKIQDIPVKQFIQGLDGFPLPEITTRVPWHNIIRMDVLGIKGNIIN